jgi:hypothetical protein
MEWEWAWQRGPHTHCVCCLLTAGAALGRREAQGPQGRPTALGVAFLERDGVDAEDEVITGGGSAMPARQGQGRAAQQLWPRSAQLWPR